MYQVDYSLKSKPPVHEQQLRQVRSNTYGMKCTNNIKVYFNTRWYLKNYRNHHLRGEKKYKN